MLKQLLNEIRKHDAQLAAAIEQNWEYPKSGYGDIAVRCFSLQPNPGEAAIALAERINALGLNVDAQAAGPYVNLTFSPEMIAAALKAPVAHPKNKKIMVLDYSSPNIAKPFAIGHLRSTVIGGSIKACYEYTGWKVIGINHIGDWGTQFGNLLAAYKRWGNKQALTAQPIEHLYEIYVRFSAEAQANPELEEAGREWFKKLETGDKDARADWKLFVRLSMRSFDKIYKVLGVKFEHTLGESFYEDKMQAVVDELRRKKLLTTDQGAQIVDFKQHGIDLVPALIIKTNATTTYVLRDVASLLYRKKQFKFDKALYEVGAEQTLHFNQVFTIVKLLGYDLDCEHITHGLYVLPEGKMSTRKGNIIFIEDIIAETTKRATQVIEEKNPKLNNKKLVAKRVALSGLIFQDLRQDRVRSVTFSWEKMLDFEGETGPYLQYTYARIASILRKAGTQPAAKVTGLGTAEELAIAKQLIRFNDTIEKVVQQAKPHILCRYLLDLAQLANTFYVKHKVIQEDKALMRQRLALLSLVNKTLKLGLKLLLIDVVEEM